MAKFDFGTLVRDMADGETPEDATRAAREAGLLDEGATLGVMVNDGVAEAMSDSPADIAAAKGMQAWLDANEPGNPNLYVFKAVIEAGITELNGINLVEAVAELEAKEKDSGKPLCQATAAMYVFAFGMVCNVLEDVASHSMEDGDIIHAMRLISARSVLLELGERAAQAYTGLPLSADIVHDLFHTLGLHCPDKDGEAPAEGEDRNTKPFQA